MIKIKKGQVWKPRLGGTAIKIITSNKTDKFWTTQKMNGSLHSHRIHEGTLRKFYELEGLDG